MAITHVRFLHSKIPPDWEDRTFEDLEQGRHVLLLDMVPEGTQTNLGQLYRGLDPALKVADCVVLRGSWPHIRQAVARDQVLREEVGNKPTVALVGGTAAARPGPLLRELPGYRSPGETPRLVDLRQAELHALLQRTGAIFTDQAVHYGLPSTYHADKFIRLADALRSLHDVDRVADWVMEFVTSETVVIADTGSLLPLLFHLRAEAARRFRWEIEIASLDEYPHDKITIIDAVDAIKNRPEIAWRLEEVAEPHPPPQNWMDWAANVCRWIASRIGEEIRRLRAGGHRRRPPHAPGIPPQFLFLVSVSSTGRLCNLFRELAVPRSKILVVCETSTPAGSPRPAEAVPPCDEFLVRIPIDRWQVDANGKCEKCEAKPIVRVHHVSYELVPRYEPKLTPLNKERAEAKRAFWEIACAVGAVQLHYDADYSGNEKYRGRHFSVYLDTLKLAAHSGFRNQCLGQLRQARPDVILIPYHTHSPMVRDLCLEAYGNVPYFFVSPVRLEGDVIAHLGSAKRVLVADDAIVTGTTLVNLRAEVFRVTQSLGNDPEVIAFVLVSRPANMGPIRAINRRYLGRKIRQLLRGEDLFLPSGQQCPWCKEDRLLRRFANRLEGVSLSRAEQRLARLNSGPMRPPLLMVKEGDAHDDLVTHGSLFGNLDHATAFAAGSCAAQTLKLELGASGGGVQFAIADLAMAIDAYYEGPLLASMLRTFDRVDARYPGSDPTVGEKIGGLNPAQAYPGVLAELALAALAGKVPGRELRQLLEQEKGNDEWLQMLADLYDIIRPI